MTKMAARFTLAIIMAMIFSGGLAAQIPAVERLVHGQTIVSPSLPAADLTFAKSFHPAGSQRFSIHAVADAEQHFFVDADARGNVRRLYWIQFEHYLPDNDHRYIYPPARAIDISGMRFIADTKLYTDYAGLTPQAGSDVEQARTLLAAKGLTLPKSAIRVRMFHAGPDNRSELMIIYLEALPAAKLPPDAANEAPMDDKYPVLAATVIKDAKASLKIQSR